MEKSSFEVYEQLELDGIQPSETVADTIEESSTEKIREVLVRFFPGGEISYDHDNDEIVLR